MASPNAVAGPSHVGIPLAPSLPGSSSAAGALSSGALAAYLAPDPAPPRPHSIIHPTHDLLGRYEIIPVYDEFVRPFNTAPISVEDKGKRREDASAPGVPPAADGADDTRSGPKEGLFQHGYKHFIKDLGLGKHNHKKDTFLTDLMLNPEKQAVPIVKLDRTTLIHAFRLKEGGVPGVSPILHVRYSNLIPCPDSSSTRVRSLATTRNGRKRKRSAQLILHNLAPMPVHPPRPLRTQRLLVRRLRPRLYVDHHRPRVS
jgi:hypothetical protein